MDGRRRDRSDSAPASRTSSRFHSVGTARSVRAARFGLLPPR